MSSWTDGELVYLKELSYEHGNDWGAIAKKFNREFSSDRSNNAIRCAIQRYGNLFEMADKDRFISSLRDIRRTKRQSSRIIRENSAILDELNGREEILSAIREVVSTMRLKKPTLAEPKRVKSLKSMTLELILSDLHYGKLTKQFNETVARERMRELARVFVREYNDHKKLFNVDRIIVALIGDIIESYTMHGLESATACEMGNSEQIVLAITSLYEDLIVPLAKLGVRIDVPCVTGNHDRTEREKTLNNVGKNNVTWIIYNVLSQMCKLAGLDNVTFQITDQTYLLIDIYHNRCLYEHGDYVKNTNKSTIEHHIAARSKQLNRVIDFFRIGHWHEVTMYEQGRVIINGCLTGQDSYADVKGYNTHAFQVINFYIETEERPNCFYKSFPVYLK